MLSCVRSNRQGEAGPGKAGRGAARHGEARVPMAHGGGSAISGGAGLGRAGRGGARQGEGANGTFYLSDVQCFERRTK